MQISLFSKEDAATAALIEKEAFSEPWTEQDFIDSVETKGFVMYALKEANRLIGYLCFTKALDEADIANVCIDKAYRGKGVGYDFFSECMQKEIDAGIRQFFLEVRKSNAPAIGLYKKCGFNQIGERKNYYHYPTEDAILMVRNIEVS